MPDSDPPQLRPAGSPVGLSIVALLFFWPLAIPAFLTASKVEPLRRRGDDAGATAAATEARKWSRLAIIVGLVWYAILALCCATGGVQAAFGTGGAT
jgi:Interferon-induced transmembrane protein